MKNIGVFLLNIAAALYLFANGIVGFSREKFLGFSFGGGEFGKMVNTIFESANGDFKYVLTIVLSVCAIAAGVFLLLTLFSAKIPITDLILLVFICLWVAFIVIVDIISPLKDGIKILDYLLQITPHIMILGTLVIANKRFS